MEKQKLNLSVVRILREDLETIDNLRAEFEPRWHVIKRALINLEK